MSVESDKTTANFLNNLKAQFQTTPYALGEEFESDSILPDQLTMSVVIPARNEFPNIVHTIYSIWHCWEAERYDDKQLEIIIVANCDNAWEDPEYDGTKPGVRGTVNHLMTRGAFYAGKVRVIYDPIAGNHSARNKGARIARGKYVFFSDAHMAYKPGFFKHMMETVDETKGLFHGSIAWMGAYPTQMNDGNFNGVGFSYTIKLGEEWKGTWNNYQVSADEYFYIPSLGHCSVGGLRKQFLEYGGYPDIHRVYGGGEFYLDMKYWMFGSCVVTHPKAIGYHLASGRGYTYTHDDYIHNVFNCAHALGCDDWLERAYINWMRRGRKEVLDRMMAEAKVEAKEDRDFVMRKKVLTFNQLMVQRPWASKNKDKHGVGHDNLLIYHDTWLEMLKTAPDYVQQAYKDSEYQEGLEKFINDNLGNYVYRRSN